MNTIKQGFRPNLNKAGYAHLTFKGVSPKNIPNKQTGELKPANDLVFEVLGAVKGTNQNITITTSLTYHPDNLLGKVLAIMGWVPETVAPALDDEDEFSQEEPQDIDYQAVLESKIDTVYIARLEEKKKRLYSIVVDSMIPYKPAEKVGGTKK